MPSFLSTLLSRLISALRSPRNSSDTSATSSLPSAQDRALSDSTKSRVMSIVWGQKVSQTFRNRIVWAADSLGVPVDYLMAVIAFETGETFSPSVKNAAGSGATGLIQFMPNTAWSLGTTTAALAVMSAEDQINYVYKYLLPYRGRMKTLSDLYMAVLWPAAIGKPEETVLWSKSVHPTTYRQNAGLDSNKDCRITKAEAAAKVAAKLDRGRLFAWHGEVKPT